MVSKQSLILNDKNSIPLIGFGTYKLNGAQGVNTITQALKNGYRALDTAVNYENEGTVGQAIKRSSIPREQLFVSSKLPGRHHHYHEAIVTIQESLYRMQLDYLDLYLIHWPNPLEDNYVEAWQALIDAQKFGLVRSIGVSNFLPEHIDRLERETGVLPVINQIELHPYWSQPTQRKYDAEHKIVTQAWSPLGRASAVLSEPVIQKIAQKYSKTVGQVILRWEIQLGVSVIPKSSSQIRQLQNKDLFDFELSTAEMESITNLDKSDGRNKNQNPATYQEF
ncbi:aldo/keto reductase [Liquorilactobacillus uvarum]|uniref:2,5-diketo-D-gluconic acid reductase n=1 Tax=Liquorilactobacillus uvarum DSM 19971 TaxID=1423812 RepID=A0A0R1PYV9_9LACO|nr:aldo/keto reductase [Liquorilactobacillus uvarum]KRL37695.1 2,5-diketo-D-gluconic acid reductase [Liquorilactobacillus uvarum DSM 19971]